MNEYTINKLVSIGFNQHHINNYNTYYINIVIIIINYNYNTKYLIALSLPLDNNDISSLVYTAVFNFP